MSTRPQWAARTVRKHSTRQEGSGAADSEALGSEASGVLAAASLIVGDGQ